MEYRKDKLKKLVNELKKEDDMMIDMLPIKKGLKKTEKKENKKVYGRENY